jgi:two-component system, NarL family, nitrate/nitrite response regulator NarL
MHSWYSRLGQPELLADRPINDNSHSSREARTQPGLLIIAEQREFLRECLTCWLGKCFQELETTAVSNVEVSLQPDTLVRAATVIIGAKTLEQSDNWLYQQIAWLRARRPGLPIVLIIDADEISAAAQLSARLDLQGYIPTFTSLEVATAAVRLVVAGGSYFPRA